MRTNLAIVLSQCCRHTTVMIFAITVAVLFSSFGETQAAPTCQSKVAQIVSIQGVVELRRTGQIIWQPAAMNMRICSGDILRTRARSRAALRLSNESMLRLDQKTTITFPREQDVEAASLLDLFSGVMHILTRTPKPFKIRTPFVNAGVEGTEFVVGVNEVSAQLVIYEGQVTASNDFGMLTLVDHETAIVRKDEAPKRGGVISPTDAVQWALYYPAIIDYRLDEKLSVMPAWPKLQASIKLYRQGRFFDAISELDQVPQRIMHTAHYLNYYAGLLLSVGSVDEAQAVIERARELESENSDTHALMAIIAVVQNDKEKALKLASRATKLDQTSPVAKLALSYAQQAHFEIEEALASVQEAVKADTKNSLAWARLAELQMSADQIDHALESARQAVNLNPMLAKTQTVLGFAYLLQIDTHAAKAIFAKAIKLNQADPLPRLGLGLALIREGELKAGRVELEIAVSLDPSNSLIRSYLGKAYFEEKRYLLASTQFDMAKERDPNDPTPWFYDAIQKQTQNRPGEALQDIQKSIELNDNRAVYRSKFLLDQDEAGRNSSLARIYDNLGFEKRAIVETAKSFSFDPSNSSVHRFLSDTYVNIPRHEIARVSELLQAQLLQPINLNPVQPRLAVVDLNIITNTGPAVTGFNEFAPLVERNKPQLVASGIVGNLGTLGNEVVFSQLHNRTSVSLGQFHYETNGFRENNDQKNNIYNAFIQHAVTPKFNVQAELRARKKEHGDLRMNFEPDIFNKSERRQLEEEVARVGAKYALTPNQDLLFSTAYLNRNENLSFPDFDETTKTKDKGYQFETQYLLKKNFFSLIGGVSFYRINVDNFGYTGSNQKDRKQPGFTRVSNKGYVYKYFNGIPNTNWTLGLSYDSIEEGRGFSVNKLNPKFGLQIDVTDFLRLRAAWFETVKTALVANQTLEPTQVAGFNQFFDDVNGTQSERKGIGLDFDFSKLLTDPKNIIYGGVEYSERKLKSPGFLGGVTSSTFLQPEPFSFRFFQNQTEKFFRAYFYWLPHKSLAFSGEFRNEEFLRINENLGFSQPSQIETRSAPLSLSYFSPSGLSASLIATIIRQNIERASVVERIPEASLKSETSNFFLLDAVLSFRFPGRRGLLSIEGRNLLNDHFSYYNSYFHISEPSSPRFVPERTFFSSVTLNF